MSERSMLSSFLNLAKTWPLCLASATIAYFTVTGLLFLLAPDVAGLIVTGVPTVRLVLSMIIVFLLLNMLLVLTYSASLLIIRREKVVEGLKKNARRLLKGFLVFCLTNSAGLALIVSTSWLTASTSSLGTLETLGLAAMNYGAGIIAAVLLAFSLTRLISSLAGVGLKKGLGKSFSAVFLVFLMLIILSTFLLPGLFIDSLLIPTVISILVQAGGEKAENDSYRGTGFPWPRGRSLRKTVTAVIFIIIVLNAELPLTLFFALGEEASFNESRLRDIVSKAVAEGWGSGELADAIRGEPELSMLSTHDLSSITVERDDAGNVAVTIPLNAVGYRVYRRASNRTTVYDVYLQSGSSEVTVGDKRYVLAGYETMVETYGPFETLEDALTREAEVKKHANSTRVTWNTTLKTESREVTRVETRYAIVPTVRAARYETLKEFDTYEAARNYLYSLSGMLGVAEVREVEKLVWVYSYRLEFERETTDEHEAMMVARDENNYLVEEVRETVTILVFEMFLTVADAPASYMGVVEIERSVFEKMVESGELSRGFGARGEYYYYASQGSCVRLYKTGERREEGSVVAWRIYRKIDTSHYETRRTYQVVIPNGYEERKISIGELPSYAKGFPSRSDAEASKPMVEEMLKSWAGERGMSYESCEIEQYEETVTRIETVAREVKQYYVTATFLKPVYDVYELQPYYRVWNETIHEERWGWVFKGYVDEPPETYDTASWIYSPEVANWTSKVYLGIVTEWEAQLLMSIDPRYVAEKHNTTTMTREIAYYDVYNATWRLLYHYYKYVVYPVREYIVNGNVSSGGGWAFESLGDASGEICGSAYRSSPSSLKTVSRSGRGAWRQTFYFDAGGSSPVLDFWYVLRGSGAVAVKKPDGSACILTLGESSGWSRFLRDSSAIFNQAGYYTVSFIASENSELIVDDVSVHVGGYGEWVYQGDVEKKPENVSSNEKYEAFYRIEDKRLIGTFEESVANQYPTPPYIKEFRRKETVSYTVDLYKLYYLEGGFVRYRVFHWEKYEVPIVVRKEETGAEWVLVESMVETGAGGRILLESNVPENVVKAKYSDPVKYYLAPKIVEGGEALELVCETLDENTARDYEKRGYVVEKTRISMDNPIRLETKVLQASIERGELNMLGKQNLLKVAVANPTGDTLAYQVVLEVENGEKVEPLTTQVPASAPAFEAERIVSVPVAEPDSWLVTAPPGGASYQLAFTVWIRRTYEGEHGSYSENVASTSEALACSFLVKVVRNGRLVAKQRVLESFESFDLGRVIARYPLDVAQGLLATLGISILTMLAPEIGLPLTLVGLTVSTVVGAAGAIATGDPMVFLTYGPTGIVVLPLRALTDPTLDDETRCRVIGALIGTLGVTVAKEISNQLYLSYAPEECKPLLKSIEEYYGSATAARVAKGLIQLDYYCSDPGSISMLKEALAIGFEKGSIREVSLLLDKVSELSQGFLSRHADELAVQLALPDPSGKIALLLSLSPGEIDALAAEYRDDLDAMMSGALLKQLGAPGETIVLHQLEGDRLSILVEKSTGEKLFGDVEEGQYAWFRLVGEDGEVSVGLPYREVVLMADRGFKEYYLFSLVDEHLSEAARILFGEIRVVPDFPPLSSGVGFPYYGSTGWGYGSIGGCGEVETGSGTFLLQGFTQELVWRSELGYGGVELNRLAFSGLINGLRVVFLAGEAPRVSYGGSYLPAVIMEQGSGLGLGELALPSGGSLILPGSSLESIGVQPGLLSIIYPNGESSTAIYTGGALQIPLFTYSSGAFVGVKPVETRVVWAGAIGLREFYSQVASVSQLLGSTLGRIFAEELVETVLQSGLTDAQALDIVNTLAKNVEWLKMLTGSSRVEAVRKITDYVKRGEAAEEAVEKAKVESEEYVRKLWIEINSFLQDIGEPELAAEVANLLECVGGNLVDEPDATIWLLGFLRSIHAEGGNAKLRSVVENVFKYRESVTQGCAVASSVVRGLMKLEREKLLSLLGETSWSQGWTSFVVSVGENRYINFGRVETAKATLLRMIAGSSEFIVIRINGHDVIRKLNPERKGSYQWMIPEFVGDFGEKGDEITVMVRPLSRREFIESVVRSLPFNLRLTLESDEAGVLTFMDALSFPVRVTRFEWREGQTNALEVDLEFRGTHRGETVPHTLAIAAKGDEVKAVIRFGETSGAVNSIRLGTLEGHIVINYNDSKRSGDFDHDTLPENVEVLYQVSREWMDELRLRPLSKEEIEEVKEWISKKQLALYGNKIRDIVAGTAQETGEIAGRKIETDPDSIGIETTVYRIKSGERVREGNLDIVFRTKGGKLIIVEVKATTDSENIQEQYSRALEALTNPGYMSLIKEYGLEVFNKLWNDGDIEAYIVIVVKTDLEDGSNEIVAMKEVLR